MVKRNLKKKSTLEKKLQKLRKKYLFIYIFFSLFVFSSINPKKIPFTPQTQEEDFDMNEIPKSSTLTKWSENGTALCTKNNDQRDPLIVSDESRGAIVIWTDIIGKTDFDIYAERINLLGNIPWSIANGTPISVANNPQQSPAVISDGKGGAIIAWQDSRDFGTRYTDIYAQHINSNGGVEWGTNGKAICNDIEAQYSPVICSDGDEGAIIAWRDNRTGMNYDIYAQWINSAGDIQWTPNGTAICAGSYDEYANSIINVDYGCAIIIVEDWRISSSIPSIYAHRINSNGDKQWSEFISNATGIVHDSNDAIGDGKEGALITWMDDRDGDTIEDISAQKISYSGSSLWTLNGTVVCNATGEQENPSIISDGAGGAIITWQDGRDALNLDIYAQKIDSSGTPKWDANGTLVCGTDGNQENPKIVRERTGGAIITWQDWRDIVDLDIYAQKIDSSGTPKWDANGTLICGTDGDQENPKIVSDGAGGAIITWEDSRDFLTTGINIYANKIIEVVGAPGYIPPAGDDDDDDEEEIDLTLPIVLTIVFVSIGGGIAVIYVLMKKGIIDISKLKR